MDVRANVRLGQLNARNVIKEHSLLEPPINVVKLAKELGYQVHKANFKNENISGAVKFTNIDDNKGVIYLKWTDASLRKRFTLAHEIGHCIMHRKKYPAGLMESINMFRNPENHSPEEIQANAFAAELLMPSDMVKAMWDKWGSTEILADIFKVSLSAMSYRLYNLNLKGDW